MDGDPVAVFDQANRDAFGYVEAGAPELSDELAGLRWDEWLSRMFRSYVRRGYAEHHVDFWQWLWKITPESDPRPFIGIFPRGGAKSTSAELGAAALILREQRKYGWYVSLTQDQADDHVQTVATMFESGEVERYYPRHSERMVGKYGDSKGWRRNRLRTAGGGILDALGLDTARRGVKVEHQRPDFMILDDIDNEHDSARITKKKVKTITTGILPAGTDNIAIMFIQNLILPNGIAAQLSDGRADFLARRIVVGPIPAVRGLKTEKQEDPETGGLRDVIVAGSPSWEGQDLQACQRLIDREGLPAFLTEAQHEVHEREGALWTKDLINEHRRGDVPRDEKGRPMLKRIVIGVDPSGGGDEIGIIAGGLGYDGHVYVMRDRSQAGSLGARNWGARTVSLYHEVLADKIVAEKNFGGDMVESNIKVSDPWVPVEMVSASRGKDVRAEPVQHLYENALIHHVGAFPQLETEMTSWVPGDPDSPNRLDALVWMVTELKLEPHTKTGVIGSIKVRA